MKYIIWMLISSIVFARSETSKKWEWLMGPSIVSFILGGFCGMFALLGII